MSDDPKRYLRCIDGPDEIEVPEEFTRMRVEYLLRLVRAGGESANRAAAELLHRLTFVPGELAGFTAYLGDLFPWRAAVTDNEADPKLPLGYVFPYSRNIPTDNVAVLRPLAPRVLGEEVEVPRAAIELWPLENLDLFERDF
jgi:hypothetical protein